MARAARSGSRIDLALLVACALLAVFLSVLPASTRTSIAGSLQRTIAAPLLALQRSAERARNALLEREVIAARVDSLALQVHDLRTLEDENTRLRSLLMLGQRLGRSFVAAEVLHGPQAVTGGGESDDLLATAGSRAGVQAGSAVVAPDGIVGRVTTVTPNSSQVILWTHPDFRASAMAVDGSAFGIVVPHGGDDPERNLLELRGVPFRESLAAGTLVVTSGLGGVFPRGIPIGAVLGEVRTTEQWSRTYLVRPAVRPQDASAVVILAPQWVSANTSQVWSTAAAADSAVRRIVAAGDSLARRDAEARAARQRALDSATALLAQPTLAPSVIPGDSAGRRPPPSALPAPGLAAPRRDTASRRPPTRRDTLAGPGSPR